MVADSQVLPLSLQTRLKYLKCMAITSLILAAKINEEDEARCRNDTPHVFLTIPVRLLFLCCC